MLFVFLNGIAGKPPCSRFKVFSIYLMSDYLDLLHVYFKSRLPDVNGIVYTGSKQKHKIHVVIRQFYNIIILRFRQANQDQN